MHVNDIALSQSSFQGVIREYDIEEMASCILRMRAHHLICLRREKSIADLIDTQWWMELYLQSIHLKDKQGYN